VVCYGGDGTLLRAELTHPSVPKVPIRNSRRGRRCLDRQPEELVKLLAKDLLHRVECLKVECAVHHADHQGPVCYLTALNEINLATAQINAAVRFRVEINGKPYAEGRELIGDGVVIATPFGSTAYFHQITHCLFGVGLGMAFKYTSEHTSHIIVPDSAVIGLTVMRGPALLAFDNAPQCFDLTADDVLTIRKHSQPAVILTPDPADYPPMHI